MEQPGRIARLEKDPEVTESAEAVEHLRALHERLPEFLSTRSSGFALRARRRQLTGQVSPLRRQQLSLVLPDLDPPVELLDLLLKSGDILLALRDPLLEDLDAGANAIEVGLPLLFRCLDSRSLAAEERRCQQQK